MRKRREDEAVRRDKSNYLWSQPESARRVIMERHRKLRKMGMKKLQWEGARRDSLPPEPWVRLSCQRICHQKIISF